MKIPETIKRSADAWARENHPYRGHTPNTVSDEYSVAYNAYLACYEKLMEGEPDGYCYQDEDGHWNDGLCETLDHYRYNSIEIFRLRESCAKVQPSAVDLPGWSVKAVKIIEVPE